MKLKKLLAVILPEIALVLELLPYGAVLNFATPEETIRTTFSYFDLTPFGYANVGPLLTAVLTCVLPVLALLHLWKGTSGLRIALLVVSITATVLSLTPLLFGIANFSLVGGLISAVLAAECVVCVVCRK